MKAVVWHGPADVRVDDVDDPKVEKPTDAVIKVPEGPPDDRFLYLSDVLPTSWQAVEYADATSPDGEGTVAVFGLGPIGQMSS